MFFKDEAQAEQYFQYLESADPSFKTFTPDQKQAYKQHILEQNGPGAKGASVDNPQEGKLFGSHKERLQSGFMSPELLKKTMKAKGYSDVATNSSGNIVVKTKDGAWMEEGGEGPVAWLERNISGAPKLAGMVVGGALGTGAGPVGGWVAAPALAGAGASVGEKVKQEIGDYLGLDERSNSSPEAIDELTGAAFEGATAELGGKLLGKIPLPYSGKLSTTGERLNVGGALHELASYPAAAYSHLMSGIPFQAAQRQFLRPQEVAGVTAQSASRAAEAELEATKKALGTEVGAAEKRFLETHGPDLTDTSVPLQTHLNRVAQKAPDEKGLGALTASQERELQNIGNKVYTTEVPEIVTPKADLPGVEKSYGLNEIDLPPEVRTRSVPKISYENAVNALKGVSVKLQDTQRARLASPGASVSQDEALLLKLQGDLIRMIGEKDAGYAGKKQAYATFQQEQFPLLKNYLKPQSQEAAAIKLTKPNKQTNQNMYEAAQAAIPKSMKKELGDLEAQQALAKYGVLPDKKRLAASGVIGSYLAGTNPVSLLQAIGTNPGDVGPALLMSALPATAMSPAVNKMGLSATGRVSKAGQLLPALLESNYNPWRKIQNEISKDSNK